MDSQLTGDRRQYQMDAPNRTEAIKETELDLAEGADMVMVKPAGSYLDILSDVAEISDVPVSAYQVSGEYAMIEAAAANGWIDRRAVVLESLTAVRRAGASSVLTYYAAEAARWIREAWIRDDQRPQHSSAAESHLSTEQPDHPRTSQHPRTAQHDDDAGFPPVS